MSGLLSDEPEAKRATLRRAGYDAAHPVEVVWLEGWGEPLSAQGACGCGWRNPAYDERQAVSRRGHRDAVAVGERQPKQGAASEAPATRATTAPWTRTRCVVSQRESPTTA